MKKLLSLFFAISVTLSACGTANTPSVSPTQTEMPTVIATATKTPIPLTATATIIPTITPTLDPLRSTPPTIMLHRPNLNFDSLSFLKDLLVILKQENMQVVTYRDIYANPALTATEKGHLFIITIDDIYLPYPVDPKVMEMITAIREAGFPAVLSVVTLGDYAYPETVSLLKKLSDEGWEIATHTNNHDNLGIMESKAPRAVGPEISISMDKIEKVIGVRPITLVLPEGQMVNDAGPLKKAGIIWAVGINGGVTYDTQRELYYVGRESPAKTAEQTFKNMKARFGF
ncbi:MAG: polysaccharide deacetylase family protein [Anaerolineae bacterium]|nr:polysaccharide deacetylase family protein [Anaerolineae bacterium]